MRTLGPAVWVIAGSFLAGATTQGAAQEWKVTFDAANLRIADGDFAHAELLLKKALELSRGIESGATQAALALNGLGNVYNALGKTLQAEQSYRQALALWDGAPGSNGLGALRIGNNLAQIYLQHGQLGDAERLLRRVSAGRFEATGPSALDLTKAYNCLFVVAFLRRKYADAAEYNRHALELCMPAGGASHPEGAIALNDQGVLAMETRRYREAIQHLSDALRMVEAGGGEPVGTVMILANLGRAYAGAHLPDQAEPLFSQAAKLAEDTFGKEDLRTARLLAKYANFLGSRKRNAEARELRARVRGIMAGISTRDPIGMTVDVSDLRR